MINEHQKPYQTTQEEQELRADCMYGKITLGEFNRRYEELKKRGLIRRNGRRVGK